MNKDIKNVLLSFGLVIISGLGGSVVYARQQEPITETVAVTLEATKAEIEERLLIEKITKAVVADLAAAKTVDVEVEIATTSEVIPEKKVESPKQEVEVMVSTKAAEKAADNNAAEALAAKEAALAAKKAKEVAQQAAAEAEALAEAKAAAKEAAALAKENAAAEAAAQAAREAAVAKTKAKQSRAS